MRTSLRMENMGQSNFKKTFEFHNFSEIFYCGMTRLRNMILGVFIQCQYMQEPFSEEKYGTESV